MLLPLHVVDLILGGGVKLGEIPVPPPLYTTMIVCTHVPASGQPHILLNV